MNWEKIYKKNDDMASREIDKELIIIPIYKTNKEINELYTLNETGKRIWELIDGTRTFKQVLDNLCNEYGLPREKIETDLAEFVKDMQKVKVIK